MRHFSKILSVFAVLSVISCSKNEAPEPNKEIGHDFPHKVTFYFKEGHLHSNYFHANPENTSLKTHQEISFTYDKNRNVTASTSNPILLVKGLTYSLEIKYFSEEGKEIQGEFVADSKRHQHFFKSVNVQSLEGGSTNSENIAYVYRDTDPWDMPYSPVNIARKRVTLRDSKDPIGFKGYFTVTESYQSFNLNVILIHLIAGSKLDENGNPYPFNKPSERLLGQTDLNLKIPMKIYTAYPETDSQTEKLYLDISKEFSVSKEEAKTLWQNRNTGEGSDYYM